MCISNMAHVSSSRRECVTQLLDAQVLWMRPCVSGGGGACVLATWRMGVMTDVGASCSAPRCPAPENEGPACYDQEACGGRAGLVPVTALIHMPINCCRKLLLQRASQDLLAGCITWCIAFALVDPPCNSARALAPQR